MKQLNGKKIIIIIIQDKWIHNERSFLISMTYNRKSRITAKLITPTSFIHTYIHILNLKHLLYASNLGRHQDSTILVNVFHIRMCVETLNNIVWNKNINIWVWFFRRWDISIGNLISKNILGDVHILRKALEGRGFMILLIR